MRNTRRSEILARVLLTLGVVLPYSQLLTMGVVFVTDDQSTSDIFNVELPPRVLAGKLAAEGHYSLWTSALGSGCPLSPGEPISFGLFATLPPAAALDSLLLIMLLIAGHGAYALSRAMGATRTGAVLGGLAYAGSGAFAGQLRHLGIVSTIAWFPLALVLLDRALAERGLPSLDGGGEQTAAPAPSPARRWLYLSLFGLVFAEQWLSGFPQSAYICALFYAAFGLVRAASLRGRARGVPRSVVWALALTAVGVLACASGAVILLPMRELANLSSRAHDLGYDFSTSVPYWPRNVITFLVPYANGDVSDMSYVGPSLFWEDYGYVGAATFLLAVYAAVRERKRSLVRLWVVIVVVAFLMVLGRATPFFRVAWTIVPGLKLFRFPTRFLFVVDLGLAILGGLGLSRIGDDMRRWLEASAPRASRWIVVGLCAGTALDLYVHQPRQNPFVAAKEWLAPPPMAALIRDDAKGDVRVHTLFARRMHAAAFQAATGWSNLGPYYSFRDAIQPNSGAYWDIKTADAAGGIFPTWVGDVWGNAVGAGDGKMFPRLLPLSTGGASGDGSSPLARALRTFGVTHLIAPAQLPVDGLHERAANGVLRLYRVTGARRVRFVPRSRTVASSEEAIEAFTTAAFDPDREVMLHDASVVQRDAGSADAPGVAPARARIDEDRGSTLTVAVADAPTAGFVVLADTYYPGWTAEVDGAPAPILRANISGRAVAVGPGRHLVRFRYLAPEFWRGLWITCGAVGALFSTLGIAALTLLRASRRARKPSGPC